MSEIPALLRMLQNEIANRTILDVDVDRDNYKDVELKIEANQKAAEYDIIRWEEIRNIAKGYIDITNQNKPKEQNEATGNK